MKFPKEKFKPQYDLPTVQAMVADLSIQPFTITALRGGLALGLKEWEMRKIVLALSRRDFYKAMPAVLDPGF